jgi:hypothetical protein
MAALELVGLDEERRMATLQRGRREVTATVPDFVDLVVLRGALARGERVIAQPEEGDWIVLGVLRTRATPGLDPGDDYTIEARRVRIEALHDFRVRAGKASFVMRARGMVETLAVDITSRARAAHKIVGRLIRLN